MEQHAGKHLEQVPVWAITNGLNNRTVFKDADIHALADHIRAEGLINPPTYWRRPDGQIQIVAGECRTRACRDILGWDTISAFIIEAATEEEVFGIMLAENERRVAVNPMDQATGFQRGVEEYGWSIAKCAAKAGVSDQCVRDRLALLTLCEEARDLVRAGQLQVTYALILAKANVPRNWQNRALDLLASNPAPSLVWWRAQVSEITALAGQVDMFADVGNWGQMAETIRAQAEKTPPVPGKTPPPLEGSTPVAQLDNQIAFWQEAANQWTARKAGRANADKCQAAADALLPMRDLLAALPLMAPPADTRALEAELARVDADRAAAETLLDEAQSQIAWYQATLATPTRKTNKRAGRVAA